MDVSEEEFEKLKKENIQLSRGGQRLLEERQAREMIEAAKETAGYWQEIITDWEESRKKAAGDNYRKWPKFRGFDGNTLAMVLEIYSRIGSIDNACRICQVSGKTLTALMREYPDVKEAVSEAKMLYAGRIQAKLTSVVFDGIKEHVYDKEGNLIRTVHKESEQLIKLAAEGAMPETYGRNKHDGQSSTIPIQINMYLDKEAENGSPITTVQMDAEGLPTPSVEVSDAGDSERPEE
jgi:hypothetical protein